MIKKNSHATLKTFNRLVKNYQFFPDSFRISRRKLDSINLGYTVRGYQCRHLSAVPRGAIFGAPISDAIYVDF